MSGSARVPWLDVLGDGERSIDDVVAFAGLLPRCDRMAVLVDGSVRVEGVDLSCIVLPVEDINGNPDVRRLFADVENEERAYYTRNDGFLIMHVIVIRRDRYEREHWLAQASVKAFTAAKDAAVHSLSESATPPATLPWLHIHLEGARRLMGYEFWPYGPEDNDNTLTTFLRYS